MRRHAVGPAAWLVDDVEHPAAWAASFRARGIDGIVEIVPAEHTVLVICDRSRSDPVGAMLDDVVIDRHEHEPAPPITIDVVYDGDDLASVAKATGLEVGEVVARHSAGVYTVAFCGFSPGFAYMTGLDRVLQIPRRELTADERSCRLGRHRRWLHERLPIGITGWMASPRIDDGSALGRLVVRTGAAGPGCGGSIPSGERVSGALRVVETGWSTTLQDLGRVGYAHLGVPHAGAVDVVSHALANRLVGNPGDATTLETAGGLVVEALGAVVAATSGDGTRHTLRPGDRLRVDPPAGGVWAYLAVRGGFDVEPVLGSRSHDTLSGVGPPVIRRGSPLGVGGDPHTELVADLAPVRPPSPVVRVWPGPRTGWFVGGLDALTTTPWTVGNDVNRVGVRLNAGAFERTADMPHHMTSEGLVVGAIEITPAGEPIVLLANHPTTGGYPVIAVVEPDDVPIVAQAPPGSTIRFRGV